MPDDDTPEPSQSKRPQQRPPWWVVIVLGAVMTAAVSAAGWAGSGVLDLRDGVKAAEIADAYRDQRLGNLEVKVQQAPVQRDLDALRLEMSGLRDDLKDLRQDLKDARRNR